MASTIKLKSGKSIPVIGFGTWNLAQGNESEAAVMEALNTGYRLLDTARIYGNEESVGKALRQSSVSRKEIFVTTKLWTSDQGYGSAHDAFDNSLNRLGLEYIDLYLIHWPGHSVKRRADSWRALTEIYKSGKSRSIGVSNYRIEHMEELANSDVTPAVNQIEFHPFVYDLQQPVLEYCKQKGIAVEAYSPLARGPAVKNQVVISIAEKMSKTPAQILLRWCIQHGTVPIPKSANPARIKENFDVFDFELSFDDMIVLDSLSSSRGL